MKPKYHTRPTQYEAFIGFCKKNEPALKRQPGFSPNHAQFKIQYAINHTLPIYQFSFQYSVKN